MGAIQRIKHRFWLSVVLLTLMSLTILVVPATAQDDAKDTIWPIVIAILFWLLALLGYWAIFSANKKRKRFLFKRFGRDIQLNFRPGALCFFSNPIATTADISVMVAMLLFGIAMLTPLKDTYLIVILLSLFTWAANMHCLFNSRTFRITKYKTKRGSKS